MRRSFTLAASFGLIAVLAGCKPSAAAQEQAFKDLLLVHFHGLNNEAEQLKIDAKQERRADSPVSLGQQFSTFDWHPDGVILEDIECGSCKTKHTIVSYRGDQLICPTCGSRGRNGQFTESLLLVPAGKNAKDLESLFAGKVKPMFDLKTDAKGSKIAVVRYVRRHWTMDPTARIESTALDRSGNTRPEAQMAKDSLARFTGTSEGSNPASPFRGGFHRVDSTFIGTTAFVYDGEISRLDRKSIESLVGGGAVDPKTWRLGGSAAIEVPVRTWSAPVKKTAARAQ